MIGIDAHAVQVEAQIGKGLPGLDVVGLPERAVKESRVRVKAALGAEGFDLPPKRLVLNLAPGDMPKSGVGFDLAIAAALLAACGAVRPERLSETLLVGELSLAGALRPVRGVLAQLQSAVDRGLKSAIIPRGNRAEASLMSGLEVLVADQLGDAVRWLNDEATLERAQPSLEPARFIIDDDLSDVRGQGTARRALEIAAAGRHHLLMIGPPGAGKTMLARRARGLLPAPQVEEALEIARIAGAAGLSPSLADGLPTRPFRAPHHTASAAALVGGGDPIRPGEVTLAHGGVLFLDELPEFRRDVIESLRTTMETGEVVIARARQRVTMPARPLVIAAMNPCPCGYAGDRDRLCSCTPDRVERYRGKISGPLLDRFDMHLALQRVDVRALRSAELGEPSAAVRARVVASLTRIAGRPPMSSLDALNAASSEAALELLDAAFERLGLSARGYVKSLKVARTIADLEGSARIESNHVAEALQYRALDRPNP